MIQESESLLNLSARGMDILESLACVDGDPELKKMYNLSLKDGFIEANTSVDLWVKVRNALSRLFG